MRRFELVQGKSSKYWEVQAEGCTVTVRFGRMGANGQTQTKTLADEAAALKEQGILHNVIKNNTSIKIVPKGTPNSFYHYPYF